MYQQHSYKGQSQINRTQFAWRGVLFAMRNEISLRIQLGCFALLLVALLVIQPGAVWAALLLALSALVLCLELVNTAIESLLDGLHPDTAIFVGVAKDCAAGAVLLASVFSVLCFVLMLFDVYA